MKGKLMKPITCELCGSNDLIKDGGVFVCQYCGTKYTVEEARKLIVEGTVSVEGIAGLDNLLLRAKEFEKTEDIDKAIEYYDRVLDLDLNNAEAKAGIARLERIIDRPNLTVTFLPAKSGVTAANLFIDGNLIVNIESGQTQQFTIPYGEHQVGAGIIKCKHPATIQITRQAKYQMDIKGRTVSVDFSVMRC